MRGKVGGWAAVVALAVAGGIVAVLLAVTSFPADVAKRLPNFRPLHDNPNVALAVAGALALIATVLGFLASKTFQGKYAAIGGLLLLLLAVGMLVMRLA